MNLFTTYEAEIADLHTAAMAAVADSSAEGSATAAGGTSGGRRLTRAEASAKCKECATEIEENLLGMDTALRNAPAEKRGEMRTRMLACKEKLDKLRVEMMTLDRRALLGEADEGDVYLDMTGSSQDQQRQQSVALLKKGEDHLMGALRDVTEMEQMAINIGADLTTQRATIEGMQDRLSDINANLERSEGLMRSIYRNMMFNKIVFGIGATAIVGAGTMLVVRFFV